MSDNQIEKFEEKNLWDKITKFALDAGREVVEKSLWLYFASQSPGTPIWAKAIIYSALAYFILPMDAIPDITPIVGYSDDLGALAAAVSAVALYIDADVKEKAKKKMADWFE